MRPDRLCRSYFTRAVEKFGSAEQAVGGGRSEILPNGACVRICVCVARAEFYDADSKQEAERDIMLPTPVVN